MVIYRVLCFEGNVLKHWEELEAPDLVACIAALGGRHDCPRLEIWKDSRRVAVLRHSGRVGPDLGMGRVS